MDFLDTFAPHIYNTARTAPAATRWGKYLRPQLPRTAAPKQVSNGLARYMCGETGEVKLGG